MGWNHRDYFGSPSPYLSYKDPQCTNGTVGNTAATDPKGFNLAAPTNCTLLGLGQVVPAGTPGRSHPTTARPRFCRCSRIHCLDIRAISERSR